MIKNKIREFEKFENDETKEIEELKYIAYNNIHAKYKPVDPHSIEFKR